MCAIALPRSSDAMRNLRASFLLCAVLVGSPSAAHAQRASFEELQTFSSRVSSEQRRKRRAGPAPLVLQLGEHVVERDVIPHDLGGYDG